MATPAAAPDLRVRAHMATAAAALDLRVLARDLSASERDGLRATLVRLLQFHLSMASWPARLRAPDATPIVAIYMRGVLRGCALERGAHEPGGSRLARAFLSSSAPIRSEPADELAAELFYPRRVRWLDDPARLEVGTEGIALVRPNIAPVLLMPQVARDHGVDARGMLALLLDKARLPDLDAAGGDARFAAWSVEHVVARVSADERGPRRKAKAPRGGTSTSRRKPVRAREENVEQTSARAAARTGATDADYAAAWLARMVDHRGAVGFAIDARARILQPAGELWHARSAIAIAALDAHGGYAPVVARARAWLAAELSAAGSTTHIAADLAFPAHWPDDPVSVIGTLALYVLAGVDVREHLLALVIDDRWRSLAHSPLWPWHAAQAALALGAGAPAPLWAHCVASLERQPFAPYVAMAARARGDDSAWRRAQAAVAAMIRREAPHRGGANATALPETGLTAVAAHALAGSREHRTAHKAALEFVRARQLLPGRIPAALDPALALGGFAATPIDDVLRADITGHALLALLAG